MKLNIKEKYKQYRTWQKKPYVVAPISNEQHICKTCQTEYIGNFCPRCSQSSSVNKFTFKNMFFSFLNVWGFGNRSFFRTLKDLIFRPGYLIRDYLSGMRMAYFPPFKLFFVLISISVLISQGMNIKGERSKLFSNQENIEKEAVKSDDKVDLVVNKFSDIISSTKKVNPAILSLVNVICCSWIFFLFFRKRKDLNKMGFAEFFISMIFISNAVSIFSIAQDFFCIKYGIVSLCILLFPPFISLKQLSGYNWTKTIFRYILSIICLLIFYTTIILSAIVAIYFSFL